MAYLRVYDQILTADQVGAIREFDRLAVNTKRYEKDVDGVKVVLDAPFRNGDKRVVKIKTSENTGLADRIDAAVVAAAIAAKKPKPPEMNPAEFGKYMMEGSNKAQIVEKA